MNEEGEKSRLRQTDHSMVRAQNDVYMVVADAASILRGQHRGRLGRQQTHPEHSLRGMRQISVASCYVPLLWNVFWTQRGRGMHGASQSDKHRGRRRQRTGTGTSGAAEPKILRGHRLPLEKLSTKKGTSAVYQLRFLRSEDHELVFRMSSALGELAG